MTRTKFFSLFIIILFCFTNTVAQDYKAEKAEIERLLNQTVTDFNDAKYDKALESSKQALINSFAIAAVVNPAFSKAFESIFP